MSEPWTTESEPATLEGGGGPVTLVQGSTFCISGRGGDIRPDRPEGLFFLDTRLLSTWQLAVDGMQVQPLAVSDGGPHTASFVSRAQRPDAQSGSVLIVRERSIGRGMREEISIRQHGTSTRLVRIELLCDVDFADLFDVKLSANGVGRPRQRSTDASGADFWNSRGSVERTVGLRFSQPPTWDGDRAVWQVTLEPGSEWRCCVELSVRLGDEPLEARFRCGEPPEEAIPARRHERWQRETPSLASDHDGLTRAWERSVEDLGSLRMFDPAHPARPVVAAGAPWFMTLFGRDSLLTGWSTLMVDPDVALGVVEALARLQGTKTDPETEEQPGRILHEVRFGDSMSMSLGDGHLYYGTADATPLFVMLIGELARWGHEPAAVDALIPAADRALEWIERFGDRDGDGYVEYERMTPRGLRNQGWKDSWDGVPSADGQLPGTPIALCEVQGYVYAAYRARADLARSRGDRETEARWTTKAEELRRAFERDYWLPERGWYALGLDGEKRPIDALASNIGHCLWTGIIDAAHARQVVDHLMSEAMFSGWGVRTLASSMARYDPLSYHDGSVWPHDNAILAAGLVRYGFVREAHRVILAMLDAADAYGGRLPELFSGVARDEIGVPVSYPTSCSPQAWAAAAPLLFVRSLLRLEPDVREGQIQCAPQLPEEMRSLTLRRVPLAGEHVTIHVEGEDWRVDGLAPGLRIVLQEERTARSSRGST